MKNWLYKTCSFIFGLTLVIYLITLYFVSYVGVYITYIAIPIIIFTGFIAYITQPNDDQNK